MKEVSATKYLPDASTKNTLHKCSEVERETD